MKEADRYLLGYGPYPVDWDRFVANSEANGEMFFKAIEQPKLPEDQGRSPDEMYMGAVVVVWNRPHVTALRYQGWVARPMIVSGGLLNRLFDGPPWGCHVDLVLETPEVLYAVKACADIFTQELDKEVYCRLDVWRQLMNTWKTRGSAMTVREFEQDGERHHRLRLLLSGGNPRALAGGKGCGGGTGTPNGVPGLRGHAEGNRT
jgi:hypothetical protein